MNFPSTYIFGIFLYNTDYLQLIIIFLLCADTMCKQVNISIRGKGKCSLDSFNATFLFLATAKLFCEVSLALSHLYFGQDCWMEIFEVF